MTTTHITHGQLRAAICAEARTWLGTPYHHMARVKGAGVDCLQILIAVYAAVGLIEPFDTGYYPYDWMLHRDEERYMQGLLQHATRTTTPMMGDVALYKFGRTYSHAAIVLDADLFIHSYVGKGVEITNPQQLPLAGRPVQYYTLIEVQNGR
jgi:cell wall-associated NlpC family hydrolase